MKYTITITCDNAAFEDDPGAEVARILRELAKRCEYEGHAAPAILRDTNGNKVGQAEVEE